MPKPWELKGSGGAVTTAPRGASTKPWEFKRTDEPLIDPLPDPEAEESPHGFWEDFGKSFLAGAVYDTGTAAYSILETIAKPFSEEWENTFRELADESAKMGRGLREEGKLWEGLGEAGFERGVDQDSWGSAIGSGAGSLTPLLAGGATFAAAGLGRKAAGRAVLGLVGLQSYGGTYQRARKGFEEQGLSEEEAARAAMLPALQQGGLDIALTALGGKVADKLGAFNIEKLAAGLGSKNTKEAMDILVKGSGARELAAKTGGKLGGIVKGGLIEGGIEEAPSAWVGEYIIARGSYDPSVTLEQANKEAWTSFVVGGTLGLAMGAASSTGRRRSPEEAAKRETIRSVAPATAAKLDERDAAASVLPDEATTVPEVRVEGAEEAGPFPKSARDEIVKTAREDGRLPLWWDRYEDTVGPDDSTVPSGLRHADQETVDRFIEDQEAHNELSQFSVEENADGEWIVSRRDEAIDLFETEAEARDAARELALAVAPRKVRRRIRQYKRLTRQLRELERLDALYQQQLELSRQQAARVEADAAPQQVSPEDRAFVAERLGIPVEELKYSGLDITPELVNELKFSPEGADVSAIAGRMRQATGEARAIQAAAEIRAAALKEARDQAEAEARRQAEQLAATRREAETTERRRLEKARADEEAAGSVPLLERSPADAEAGPNSAQLAQLAENELDSGRNRLNPSQKKVLRGLLNRRADLIADAHETIEAGGATDLFVESVADVDSRIASLLGEVADLKPHTRIDAGQLVEMADEYGAIPGELAPEPAEPVATMTIDGTEIEVVHDDSPVDAVTHAARPPLPTAEEMTPTMLKSVEAALARLSKRFGSLLQLRQLRLTKLNGGAGVSSLSRAGVTDTILIDPKRLLGSLSNKKFSLEKALEEELLHNLDGQALRAEYARLIQSGELSPTVDLRSFIEGRYRSIAQQMTPDEREAARRLYGNEFADDVHMAQEFVRQLLQQRHTKSITEEAYRSRPVRRLMRLFQRMFQRMELSGPLKAHLQSVERFLERADQLELKEATRAETKARLKEEKEARRKLIREEKEARKKRITDEAKLYEDAYEMMLSGIGRLINSGEFLSMEEQDASDMNHELRTEVFEVWRQAYQAGELSPPIPNQTWFYKVARRRAINLINKYKQTEKRGSGVEFLSLEEALEEHGIDPEDTRSATPAGERLLDVVKEMRASIGLNATEMAMIDGRFRNYSNSEMAKFLRMAETSTSTAFTKAVEKVASAARSNEAIREALEDAVRTPTDSAAAHAADPFIEPTNPPAKAETSSDKWSPDKGDWMKAPDEVGPVKSVKGIIAAVMESTFEDEAGYPGKFGKEDSFRRYTSFEEFYNGILGSAENTLDSISGFNETTKEQAARDWLKKEIDNPHPQNWGESWLEWNKRFLANQQRPDSGAAHAAAPGVSLASRILAKLPDIKKRLFRAFSSDGGLIMPSAANADKQLDFFKVKIGRDAYINSVMGEVKFAIRALKQAANKELGEVLSPEQVTQMNDALNGNAEAMAQLPAQVGEAVAKMRTQIDALSGYIVRKGWVTGDLKAVIDKNIGAYLARSYRIFDDPDYKAQIEPEVINRAVNFVERQLIKNGLPPSQAQHAAQLKVQEMLDTYSREGGRDLFDRGKLGEKDLSLFMKRKEIAPEIRALLGEYTDPAVNYARSVSRLAHFVGNHTFLTQLRKAGMNEVFFEESDTESRLAAGATVKIPGSTTVAGVKAGDAAGDPYSPLAGLYTTPDVLTTLEQYDQFRRHGERGLIQWLAKANVVTKSLKTVFSVMTHARNAFGQPFFLLKNGHNPFAFRLYAKAIKAVWADARGSDAGMQAYFNKMTRLGLVGEEITTSELRRVLGDYQAELDGADSASSLLDKGTGRMLKTAKRTVDGIIRVYRATDEVGKIVHFELERNSLRPLYPDLSEAQLDEMAAERTRGGVPTYSMLPPAIQEFRKQPFIGPFTSFFYESGRTQLMNIKYAALERKRGHTGYANRRIAGHLAATVLLGYGLQELTKLWFGISDEEEEGFREFLPDWEKDAQFILWRDEDDQLQYINISYNNPYASTTDKILAMAHLSGRPEETIAGNIVNKAVEMLDPFSSETIVAQAVLDIRANKDGYGNKVYNEQDDAVAQWEDIVSHAARAFTPGTVDRAVNKWADAYKGKTTPGSTAPDLTDELVAEFTGFKVRTLDYKEAMQRGTYQAGRDLSEANYIFNKVAGRRGSVSEGEMTAAYESANASRYRIFQRLSRQVDAAKRGGLTQAEIIRSMREGKLSTLDTNHTLNGLYRPMAPSHQIQKRARDNGHPIPLGDIREIQARWMRKPLSADGE